MGGYIAKRQKSHICITLTLTEVSFSTSPINMIPAILGPWASCPDLMRKSTIAWKPSAMTWRSTPAWVWCRTRGPILYCVRTMERPLFLSPGPLVSETTLDPSGVLSGTESSPQERTRVVLHGVTYSYSELLHGTACRPSQWIIKTCFLGGKRWPIGHPNVFIKHLASFTVEFSQCIWFDILDITFESKGETLLDSGREAVWKCCLLCCLCEYWHLYNGQCASTVSWNKFHFLMPKDAGY